MDKALDVSNEKKLENISNEDWPLLKELETTRFSLKNKKNINVNDPLEKLKALSEKEDELLSEQNIQDEKLVEEFIEMNKGEKFNLEEFNQSNVVQTNEGESVTKALTEKKNNEQIVKTVNEETQAVQKPIQIVQNQQTTQQVGQENQNKNTQNEEMASLVAKGMAKVYMQKTDTILSPLEFLIKNFKNIASGLIQFIIPAIITWLVLTKVDFVAGIMAKETTNMQYFYTTVFYFACLFSSITIQVIVGGMVNIFGMAFKNLAEEAKLNK